MSSSLYFDNASTSYPKPSCVINAMVNYFHHIGANTGRSGYKKAQEIDRIVFETRERIAKLIGVKDSSCLIFTSNATEGLNLVLLGLITHGEVVTSSVEHNSVMRVLRFLQQERNVKVKITKCSREGILSPSDLKKNLSPHTTAIVLTAVSNVLGTMLPLSEVGEIAQQYSIPFIVDGAQGVGKIPIDVEKMGIDAIAFSGHKGVLGPQGIGCVYISKKLNLPPLKYGGTGSFSDKDVQPDFLPDKYESGTLNTIGIVGLNEGVKYVMKVGIEEIRRRGRELRNYLWKELEAIPEVILYGPPSTDVPIVSFTIHGFTPSFISYLLDHHYNIMVRPGLHCSPHTHKTIGTFPTGTVRVSLGIFNTKEEINLFISSLTQIITHHT
jgi:cysteine desulfurase family protein